MSKRDNLYLQVTNINGVIWPHEDELKAELVVELFGATVMGAMDTVITNRKTGNEEFDKKIREACASTLYWLFVRLDQFPGANVTIELEKLERDNQVNEKLDIVNEEELRLLFFEWLEKYSDTVPEDGLINR